MENKNLVNEPANQASVQDKATDQPNRNISNSEPSEKELSENLSGADSGMEKPKGQDQ